MTAKHENPTGAVINRREDVLAEVAVERQHQDRRWGEQNHPDRMTMYGSPIFRMAYGIESAAYFQRKLADANRRGECSWDRILLEEVAEAMDECAEDDVVHLREELVQVAAVAVAWVECIDRRIAASTKWPADPHENGRSEGAR